jgi:hypothetical protein
MIFESQGIQIHIQHKSLDRLLGCVIDYTDGLQGAGFKISNPTSSPPAAAAPPTATKSYLMSYRSLFYNSFFYPIMSYRPENKDAKKKESSLRRGMCFKRRSCNRGSWPHSTQRRKDAKKKESSLRRGMCFKRRSCNRGSWHHSTQRRKDAKKKESSLRRGVGFCNTIYNPANPSFM